MEKIRDKKLTNIYNILPDECKSQAILDYPNRQIFKIDIPFRALICAQTGGSKTQFLLNMLDRLNCFSRFYLFCRDITEPLYKFLITKLHHMGKKKGEELVFFSNRLSNLPEPEELDPHYSNVIIVDDMLAEKMQDLDKVAKLAVFARHYNCSMIFLVQSFYCVPRLFRDQCNYIFIKKHNSVRRLKQVINQYSGGTNYTEKELIAIYEEIIKEPLDALLFDIQTTDERYKVRRNFQPIEETGLVEKAREKLMEKNDKYRQEKGISSTTIEVAT